MELLQHFPLKTQCCNKLNMYYYKRLCGHIICMKCDKADCPICIDLFIEKIYDE